MSSLFLSYRFTGEDPKELEETLTNMRTSLEKNNHQVFCSYFLEDFFQKNNFTSDDMYEYCVKEQENYQNLLLFVKNSNRSTGMDMEVLKGKELQQKIVLLTPQKPKVNFYREDASEIITYTSFNELYDLLKIKKF